MMLARRASRRTQLIRSDFTSQKEQDVKRLQVDRLDGEEIARQHLRAIVFQNVRQELWPRKGAVGK